MSFGDVWPDDHQQPQFLNHSFRPEREQKAVQQPILLFMVRLQEVTARRPCRSSQECHWL